VEIPFQGQQKEANPIESFNIKTETQTPWRLFVEFNFFYFLH
jgi:hypothetical protein